MTFLELCQRLRQEVGAAGTGPAAVTGQHGEYQRLIGWVAQAWREIQLERRNWRFAWAEASVALDPDFREYSPPADIDRWDAATLRAGSHPLVELEWEIFRERYRSDSGRDHPTVITRMPNGNLRLDTPPPAANTTLSFEYFRTPQTLAANGDTPRMPGHYHMLIVYRAMLSYALYENAPEVAQKAQRGEQSVMTAMEHAELPAMDVFGGPVA
ncbi:phage adaptor protein [Halomonas koreensis]|uniref:Uncharacterized protein n=1 Tax=Halomonas koreensis TaxID=245385 RepID=A0ABU1G614_9GAMM|nr:hypothetical protein [Halomonas koreensis]MDR5867927.1 hypothetical protein [Halomonas koreensis]